MYNSDKRILYLISLLIFLKVVKTNKSFCQRIGLAESTPSKVKRGEAHFTAFCIEQICKEFNVNANWIFATENKVFKSPKSIEIKENEIILE